MRSPIDPSDKSQAGSFFLRRIALDLLYPSRLFEGLKRRSGRSMTESVELFNNLESIVSKSLEPHQPKEAPPAAPQAHAAPAPKTVAAKTQAAPTAHKPVAPTAKKVTHFEATSETLKYFRSRSQELLSPIIRPKKP